jgi:hypothetical protein
MIIGEMYINPLLVSASGSISNACRVGKCYNVSTAIKALPQITVLDGIRKASEVSLCLSEEISCAQ